jgi:hypothetical protein
LSQGRDTLAGAFQPSGSAGFADKSFIGGAQMQFPWQIVQSMQDFFQLNFLFSGLEVSSTTMIAARIVVFILSLVSLSWFGYRIVIKLLECVQEFLKSTAPIPKSFFIFLFLAVPLSSDSIGAKWIGYILLVFGLIGAIIAAALLLVVWKYGVDHALKLINFVRRPATNPPTSDRPQAEHFSRV